MQVKERERIFWTTLTVSFVLLVHNGTGPLFLVAYAFIPILILLFYRKSSLWPLALYLIGFGILGRYTRYVRENYASDTILAIRDYIGYLLAGKNVYQQQIMAQSGLTPFTYLPFSLFWYLPAYIASIDLRFFEMLVSSLVPVLVLIYGFVVGSWSFLPVLSVTALTPFLLDLSSDGSNDNSAIFLLLVSLVCFALARKHKAVRWAVASAVVLGLAASFKHYIGFFLVFFLPFVGRWGATHLPVSRRTYLVWLVGTFGLVSLPFIIASPTGFAKSLVFIEYTNWHTTWGWNIWVALRDGFHVVVGDQIMWLVRTIATGLTVLGIFLFGKPKSLRVVYVAAAVTMLVYCIFSKWTSYAYFTFLVPLLALAAIEE